MLRHPYHITSVFDQITIAVQPPTIDMIDVLAVSSSWAPMTCVQFVGSIRTRHKSAHRVTWKALACRNVSGVFRIEWFQPDPIQGTLRIYSTQFFMWHRACTEKHIFVLCNDTRNDVCRTICFATSQEDTHSFVVVERGNNCVQTQLCQTPASVPKPRPPNYADTTDYWNTFRTNKPRTWLACTYSDH